MRSEHTEHVSSNISFGGIIHVASYSERVLRGIIYSPFFGEKRFRSTMELILFVENQIRNLNQKGYMPDSLIKPQLMQGHWLNVFPFHVAFQQNFSWQGSVSWRGTDGPQRFRSTLELLLIIDSVLHDSLQISEQPREAAGTEEILKEKI